MKLLNSLHGQKKNCYVALSRTVKCEKTGWVFFFFFLYMSDLGEECAKICIQWLKKALVYMPFDCIPPEWSLFRNFWKKYWKTHLSRYIDRPKCAIIVGWVQIKKTWINAKFRGYKFTIFFWKRLFMIYS